MQGGGPFQRDFRKSMFHDGRLYAQWIERLEEFGINVRTVCLSVHLSMFVSLSVCCSVYQPVCLQFCLHQPSSILLMESLISLISPHMYTHTPHTPPTPHTLPLSSHSHSTHTPHTSTPITPHTPHTSHPHSTHSTHSHSTSTHSTHFAHTHTITFHTPHTIKLHTHSLYGFIQEPEENNAIPEYEGDTSQSQRSRTPSPLPEGKEKAKEEGGRDNGTVKIHVLCSLTTHGSIHECVIVHLHISLDTAHC